MRITTLRTAAITAGLVLALGACTSEDPASDTSTDDAAVTSDDGLEGSAGNRGWMCQYVSPTAIELANGGEAETPRQLTTEDDDDAWVCDVLVGGKGEQEPVVRVGIYLGDEARAEARTRAEEADGVEAGPDHLGVSFISPGLVTGLTLCTDLTASDTSVKIPYTIVIESLGETDEEVTHHLELAATEAAKSLDKGVGCSPKRAIEEDRAAQSEAP